LYFKLIISTNDLILVKTGMCYLNLESRRHLINEKPTAIGLYVSVLL